jgi:hypothetical protein
LDAPQGERFTQLEISGVMDRHAAEALQLEARRLAKRYGIDIRVQGPMRPEEEERLA